MQALYPSVRIGHVHARQLVKEFGGVFRKNLQFPKNSPHIMRQTRIKYA
jgi:hypothetical protein